MSQMEAGVSVGIPVLKMLSLLHKDTQNKFLKTSLAQIAADVNDGSTLHDSFAKHSAIFDPITVGLVKTGEVSGKLEETLGRITKMIEQQAANQAKIKSATFYPKIVIFVLIGVLVVVVTFIIPKLKTFLTAYGTDLPPITKFVVGSSDFMVSYWYLFIVAFFVLRAAFNKYFSTAIGKLTVDRISLKLPIFGPLFTLLELNNICVILDLLIASGIPLLEALETLKDSQKNEVFKNALSHCQQEIAKGGTLTQGMEGAAIFPDTFKNLMSMGEESGMLEPVLKRLGKYYQVQIDSRLDNLSKLIEPILLFFIFGVVLVIALAVMLPIWQLSGGTRPKF